MDNTTNSQTETPRPVRWSAWLGGIRVIESEHCQTRTQYRFPRSKKRRIREKWAKREQNYRDKPTAYLAPENTIYCHPSIAARLRAELPPNDQAQRPRTNDDE